MTHSHTPGPWYTIGKPIIHENHPCKGMIAVVADREASGRGDRYVAFAAYDEAEANARLVAAAPELLDVAKLLTRACGIQANLLSTASDAERRDFIKIIFKICDEVAAPAIAKAEGGTE
jgi:hypothetical protein